MERLIWGMKVIAFSQLELEKNHSHQYVKAVDMQGSGSGQEDFYAPCTCKVINKSSSAHTVFFVSCDENGNETEVMCADGVPRIITFALTHIDDFSWIKNNMIFKAGEKCYREGTYASGKKGAVGTHVHVETAVGKVSFKVSSKIDGKSVVRFNPSVAINPTDIFFALKGYHSVREDKLVSVNKDRRVTLKWTDSRIVEESEMKLRMKAVKEVVVLRETISFNSSKRPNGKILAKMNLGQSARVIATLPIQKDGYQWLRVEFNGMVGYMQYDSKCYEIEFY